MINPTLLKTLMIICNSRLENYDLTGTQIRLIYSANEPFTLAVVHVFGYSLSVAE